jgi:hypothetical protein
MLYELITVFLIIGLSFVFKLTSKIKLDLQLSFICLTFLVLITYKMMVYYRTKKNLTKFGKGNEGFYDFSKEVNEFISGDLPNNLNSTNVQEYKEELNKLQEQVSVMNEYLSNLNKVARGEVDNKASTPLDEINIQASQQIQDYRIKKLNDEIEQTTDLIKKAKLRDDAKSFKKIPVYSSCVVSNADGSYSVDTPNDNSELESNIQKSITNSNNTNVNNGLSTNNTISNLISNNQSNTSQLSSNNGGGLNQLLNKIQNDGLVINLDTRQFK